MGGCRRERKRLVGDKEGARGCISIPLVARTRESRMFVTSGHLQTIDREAARKELRRTDPVG